MTLELTPYQADRVAAALTRRIRQDMEWLEWLRQCACSTNPHTEDIESTLRGIEASREVLAMIQGDDDG